MPPPDATPPSDLRPTMGQSSLVVARGLTKRFGDFVAVDGIDFEIGRGESYGLLGPNGAGKTSTMRMIACMSPVSAGTLRVLGMDPAHEGSRIRSRIGIVPQEDTLDLELTVLDNLMVYGRYFDLPRRVIRDRAEQLLEFTQLIGPGPRQGGSLVGRDEAPPHHRPLARLGSRAADPRRAHHRPRPTGPPPAVGPPLPPEATGCHPGHHHALHGRGRAAVRPPRRHGRGAGSQPRAPPPSSSPGTRRERFSSCASATPTPTPKASRRACVGRVQRFEALPDRLLLYTDDGEATLTEVHELGINPDSALVRRSTLEDVFLRLTGRSLVD